MVGIRIQGRLGNQLFQYAFGYAISKKLNTNFFLDETYYSASELKSFFELKSYSSGIQNKVQKFYFDLRDFKNKIIQVNHGDHYESFLNENNRLYSGYYQSEYYFQDCVEQVKAEFKIRQAHIIDVRNYLKIKNSKQLIVVHVRRTDYEFYGKDSLGGKNLTLPLSYYDTCLKHIKDLENYNLVFVTDDKDYVFDNFYQYNPIVSSSKFPIVDFQILLKAEIVIVANSSFSWWGAYLNNKASRILAPKYWLGFKVKKDYPKNIIPSTWETVEF